MLPEFINSIKFFALARSLMSALDLDILPLLAESSLSRTELIQKSGLADAPTTHAFLDVLIASDILSETDGKITLSPLGQSVLPSYETIKSWNEEMDMYYRSLENLDEILKTGDHTGTPLTEYWAYKTTSNREAITTSDVEAYSLVMANSQTELSQAILNTYDFSNHKHLIDFGGGYGQLAIEVAKKHPHLKITVADLPSVSVGAKERIAKAGFASQIECLPVDFLNDDLPTDFADIILFSRVIHDWDDANAKTLLKRTKDCLTEHGVALVAEPMTDDNSALIQSSAFTNLMLTLMGGRRRSIQTMMGYLESSGYQQVTWKDCGFSLYKMVIASL